MRIGWISAALFALGAGFPALCARLGGADFWTDRVVRPLADGLGEIAVRLPFPALEVLAVGLSGAAIVGLVRSVVCMLRKKSARPLMGWAERVALLLAVIFLIYAVGWAPSRFAGNFLEVQTASAEEMWTLCWSLIGELNDSALRFSGDETALHLAAEAMELPESSARFVRYPEWMRGLHLAGLYSPWTGEALINPDAFAGAIPFTACHELAHRLGVGDEFQANIAAYNACREAGGELADSAKLWALRYGMDALRRENTALWEGCVQRMSSRLRDAFSAMGGLAETEEPSENGLWSALGLSSPAGRYSLLAHWLARERAI